MGLQTIERFDALGRLISLEKRRGERLFLEEYTYAHNNNKILQTETVPVPGGATRQITLRCAVSAKPFF